MNISEFFIQLKKNLLYGTVAGIGASFCSHPFDTIKTRKQVLDASYWKLVRDVFLKESPFAFYKGFTSTLATLPLTNAVFFTSFSLTLWYINLSEYSRDWSEDSKILVGGMTSGASFALVASPSELFKMKLQIQRHGVKVYKGNWDLARKIYRVSGVSAICQGMYLTLINYTCSYSAYFYWYHKITEYFRHRSNIQNTK